MQSSPSGALCFQQDCQNERSHSKTLAAYRKKQQLHLSRYKTLINLRLLHPDDSICQKRAMKTSHLKLAHDSPSSSFLQRSITSRSYLYIFAPNHGVVGKEANPPAVPNWMSQLRIPREGLLPQVWPDRRLCVVIYIHGQAAGGRLKISEQQREGG
jgi:hypothetical protein